MVATVVGSWTRGLIKTTARRGWRAASSSSPMGNATATAMRASAALADAGGK